MDEKMNAQQRLATAIKRLLTSDRLAGEVLINISREIHATGQEPLGLEWQQDQMILTGSAQQIMVTPLEELVNNCHHQALHIIWRHPIRYAAETDRELVSIACDVAVNQYLPAAVAGTMTLDQLRQIMRQPLAAGQDSGYYLQKLRQMDAQQRRRFQQAVAKSQLKDLHNIHAGWFRNGNNLIRTGRLTQAIRHSAEQLTGHQRGLLPQPVQEMLKLSDNGYKLPLQQAFWKLVGPVPAGYQPSRARFNRRQPYRLELPGRVTRFINQLYVFVDQSGSMSNDQISRILDVLNRLAQHADLEMLVGAFDAQIQMVPQAVNKRHRLEMKRHGGGGTSYQPLFSYLDEHHISKATPVLIITDGWGENAIETYGFQRILWLLTPDGKLSVEHAPGQISRLEDQ